MTRKKKKRPGRPRFYAAIEVELQAAAINWDRVDQLEAQVKAYKTQGVQLIEGIKILKGRFKAEADRAGELYLQYVPIMPLFEPNPYEDIEVPSFSYLFDRVE